MTRLRKDVEPLLSRGIESLTLAIEIFNRPSELARTHAVLILLQHAFEMLLKAIILDRKKRVHDRGGKYSYGFDKCLTVVADDLKLLDKHERASLSILDAQRDQAAHYYTDVSEELLYVHTQSAVTLFTSLLSKSFKILLTSRIPNRVLPVSARPPRDIEALFDAEFADVDRLLEAGRRQGARAAAKLRSVLAFAAGSRETEGRVSELDLASAVTRRRRGEEWQLIFPEIAQLRLSTDGSGIPINMRISKDASIAVRVAKPGEEVVGTLIKQEINLFDVFNLTLDDIAGKFGLSRPRALALIYELKIQDDPTFYRVFQNKTYKLKRYSKKALDHLREAKPRYNLDEVWEHQKGRLGSSHKGRAG